MKDISHMQKTHYKSACNWIKSSVSSMTSAEDGQPPSNEPEEWKDTHPLSPLRWGTTLLTRWGSLHFYCGDGGILKIARVANCKYCKLQVLQIAIVANRKIITKYKYLIILDRVNLSSSAQPHPTLPSTVGKTICTANNQHFQVNSSPVNTVKSRWQKGSLSKGCSYLFWTFRHQTWW